MNLTLSHRFETCYSGAYLTVNIVVYAIYTVITINNDILYKRSTRDLSVSFCGLENCVQCVENMCPDSNLCNPDPNFL